MRYILQHCFENGVNFLMLLSINASLKSNAKILCEKFGFVYICFWQLMRPMLLRKCSFYAFLAESPASPVFTHFLLKVQESLCCHPVVGGVVGVVGVSKMFKFCV